MAEQYHDWPADIRHPMEGREAMHDECLAALAKIAGWVNPITTDAVAPANIRETATRLRGVLRDAAMLLDDLDLLMMTGGHGATMVSLTLSNGTVGDVDIRQIPEGGE